MSAKIIDSLPSKHSAIMRPIGSRIMVPPPNVTPRPLSPVALHDATNTELSYALAGRVLFHTSSLHYAASPDAVGISTMSAPRMAYVRVMSGKWDSQQSCIPRLANVVGITSKDPPALMASASMNPRCVFL